MIVSPYEFKDTDFVRQVGGAVKLLFDSIDLARRRQ